MWRASTGVILYTVYKTGFRTHKIALPPNTKPRRGGGLMQITNAAKSLYRQIFLKKSRHLGFGVFIVIWSMPEGLELEHRKRQRLCFFVCKAAVLTGSSLGRGYRK